MNTLVKVYLSPLKWVITYVGNWILNCLKSSRRQKPGQPEQRSIPSVSRLLCLHVYMCVWADFCDSSRAIFFFYVSVNLPESLLFLQSASVVLFVFFCSFFFFFFCQRAAAVLHVCVWVFPRHCVSVLKLIWHWGCGPAGCRVCIVTRAADLRLRPTSACVSLCSCGCLSACVYVRVPFVGSCLACGEHLACAGWGFAKRSDSECYWLRVTIIGLPCVCVRVGAGQGCRGGFRLISLWLDCDSPVTFEEEVVFLFCFFQLF